MLFEMFRSLLGAAAGQPSRDDDVALAAAVLLVFAARLDGAFEPSERDAIRAALIRRFALSPGQVEPLIEEADRRAEESRELYTVTREIKDSLSPGERIGVIEMLWEVAFADGAVHDYEANLVRRAAGLLYVADVDSGAARRRVAERFGIATLPSR
jgi:uncharacterized tellurite resistance protein B-like protein